MKRTNVKVNPEALKAIRKLKDYLENKDEIISEDYFKFIQHEFILFIGPIAPVVLEEEIKNMGFDQKFFPENKVPELLKNITYGFEGNQYGREHFMERILKSSYALQPLRAFLKSQYTDRLKSIS